MINSVLPPPSANPNPTPPPSPEPQNKSTGRWPFSMKATLIVGGIIFLVIIGVITAIIMNVTKKSDGKGLQTDSYIAREGYSNDTGAVGDATALFSAPSGKTISYNGNTIIQPCGIVTIEDLRAKGVLISADGQTTPIEQNTYIEQGSKTIDKPSESFLDRFEEANTCQYVLESQPNAIEITAYQAFNTSPIALQREIDRSYAPEAPLEGLPVYVGTKPNKSKPNETAYIIRGTNASIEIHIGLEDAAKKKAVLAIAVKRLKEAETRAMESLVFTIRSPIMSKSVYMSCSMLDDANFKQVMGVEAGPFLNQKFASAVGIVSIDGQKDYNFVSHDCSRRVAYDQGEGAFALRTTTYEDEEMAKWSFQFEQQPLAFAKNVQQVTPAIGDESFYGDVSRASKSLVVRKGRLMLYFTYDATTIKDLTPEKRIATLRPVVEAELAKLNY